MQAAEILSLVDWTEKELIEQEELVEGRIVIGCGELAAVQVLPEPIDMEKFNCYTEFSVKEFMRVDMILETERLYHKLKVEVLI